MARFQGANALQTLQAARDGTYEVLLSSYTMLSRHAAPLAEVAWLVVVCDEAHQLRTHSSKQFKAAHALPCARRLALSGSAMDLNLKHLWNVLEWTNPGRLGDPLVFQARYSQPILEGQKLDASPQAVCLADVRAKELLNLLQPVLVRRYGGSRNRGSQLGTFMGGP